MNYKDGVLPDYQFEGNPLTLSIVKQILMQRGELPYLTTEELAEYVRDCCVENEEKPLEKDLRTIVAKALISLNHERLSRQKVSLDRSTSQWKVFKEQYTLSKHPTDAGRRLNRLNAFLEESPDNDQPELFYPSEEWKEYSEWYRKEQDWRCEACKLSLASDRQYLHTHHTRGRRCNDPKDFQALCIACHSEQPGANHKKLATEEDYHKFKEKYGD